MNRGLIIAAPASGNGKTTLTLGLLRAFKNRGERVRGAKSGPDYIDPRFHEAACDGPCLNLDAWAMRRERIASLVQGDGLLLIEGAMGLFDGAPPDGKGACADLARDLGLPVVLVIDAAKMAQSVAALVAGFVGHDPQVRVAGLILNKVGSARHETMLRRALEPLGLPVLGALHRQPDLVHPSRHLGLVQAGEHPNLQRFLEQVAAQVAKAVDLDALAALAAPITPATARHPMPPPAQSIAIAKDAAFAFAYPHLLNDWRAAGAGVSFFSPLNDEAPAPSDLVFLPGGYPELYGAQLAGAATFGSGMRRAAKTGRIYGECGGYMVLGKTLTDAKGVRHQMLGLLDLETSFASRKLHLGYRHLAPKGGVFSAPLMGHEFHYATTTHATGPALFDAKDAETHDLAPIGLINGSVSGSFAHVIDKAI